MKIDADAEVEMNWEHDDIANSIINGTGKHVLYICDEGSYRTIWWEFLASSNK